MGIQLIPSFWSSESCWSCSEHKKLCGLYSGLPSNCPIPTSVTSASLGISRPSESCRADCLTVSATAMDTSWQLGKLKTHLSLWVNHLPVSRVSETWPYNPHSEEEYPPGYKIVATKFAEVSLRAPPNTLKVDELQIEPYRTCLCHILYWRSILQT